MGNQDTTTVPGNEVDVSKTKAKEKIKKSVLDKGIVHDYFVGTLPDCPRQNLTLGGISFPRHTNDFKANPESNVEVPVQKTGLIIGLDGYKLEDVKKAISRKVFRGQDLVVKDETYRPMLGDKPVGQYIYMILVSEAVKKDHQFRDSENYPDPFEPRLEK